jgi:ATPase subunit of ABC transporter with duplicated ATPase domains
MLRESFPVIALSNINKQYGKQLVFVEASFQLNPGEKVGLVGPNGAGKTTLFRMIVGEEAPGDGEVTVPKRLTISYFRQDVEEMTGRLEDAGGAGAGAAGAAGRAADGRAANHLDLESIVWLERFLKGYPGRC